MQNKNIGTSEPKVKAQQREPSASKHTVWVAQNSKATSNSAPNSKVQASNRDGIIVVTFNAEKLT